MRSENQSITLFTKTDRNLNSGGIGMSRRSEWISDGGRKTVASGEVSCEERIIAGKWRCGDWCDFCRNKDSFPTEDLR
ncbi:hypothetical protein SLE2022_040010 [Rubroshorea leprosula]